MLSSVILVLREVLEAALIISLLLALTGKLKLNLRWGFLGLAGGLLGSWCLAHYFYQVTEAMDGAGQELLNTLLLLVVIGSLVIVGLMVVPLSCASIFKQTPNATCQKILQKLNSSRYLFYGFFLIAVSAAMSREGSEIWIYMSSFFNRRDVLYSALVGGAIGAGIGISLGALAYYLFTFMPRKYFLLVFLLTVSLIAGGLAMQVGKELMQIGWLESAQPIWDTSFIVDEHSLSGELLYALLGYEAKPTTIQSLLYLLTIMPVGLSFLWQLWTLRAHRDA